MATRCINFSKEADEVLPKLAAQHGLNMSEYLSKLVMEADAQCTENLATMREEMERLRRAEAANGKNISALVEMLNTYFKMFATGEGNESEFFSVDDQPHPWTRKAFEVVEAKLRVAIFNRKKK
jgi:DNA-binding protein H-NS